MKHSLSIYPAVGLILTACASTPPAALLPPPEPVVIIREVKVPVPTPCVTAIPDAPAYADSDMALSLLMDDFAGAWKGANLLIAARQQRDAYIGQLRAVLQACMGPVK